MPEETPASFADAADETRVVQQGLAFGMLSYGVGIVISVGTAIVSSRRFGIENIGGFALVMTLWLLVYGLSSANEQTALIRELHGLEPRSEEASGRFYAVLAFSSALTIAVSILASIIGGLVLARGIHRQDLVAPAVVLLLAYVVFDNTSWNMQTVLSSFRAGRDLFVIRTYQNVALLLGVVGFSLVTHDVWGLVLANVVSFFVEFVATLFMFKKVFRFKCRREVVRGGFSRLPAMLRFAGPASVGTWVRSIGGQASTWIFGSISNAAEIGSYARAAGITSNLSTAGVRVSEIAYPTFVRYRAEADEQRFDKLFVDVTRFFLVVMGAAAVGSAVAGKAVLRVFGRGFEHGSTAMTILAGALVLDLVNGIEQNALFASERPGWILVTDALRTVVMLVLVVPLVRQWGASGYAAAMAAGIVVSVGTRSIVLARAVFARRTTATLFSLLVRWVIGLGASIWVGHFLAGDGERGARAATGLAVALLFYGVIATLLRTFTLGDLRRAARRRR